MCGRSENSLNYKNLNTQIQPYNVDSIYTKNRTFIKIPTYYTNSMSSYDYGHDKIAIALFGTEINTLNDELNETLAYLKFKIPKKDGSFRLIYKPSELYKTLQKRLLKNLFYLLRPGPNVYGFIKNKNVVDMASNHINKQVIIGIDVKDFFISFNRYLIYNAIIKSLNKYLKKLHIEVYDMNYFKYLASTIYKIVTMGLNFLPVGASTSPVLSNIILQPMDISLSMKLNKFYNSNYTRYADDIIISYDEFDLNKSKIKAYNIISIVKDELDKFNLHINKKKLRIISNYKQQKVVGIIVNKKLNISKKYYLNTKAGLHNILTGKVNPTKKQLKKLEGRVNWIYQVNVHKGKKLINMLQQIKTSS